MYRSTAHFYEFFNEEQIAEGTATRVEFLRDYLQTNSSVLDIGAGTGATAIALANVGHRVTCIEPSEDMQSLLLTKIARNREICPLITLLPIDIQNLDIPKKWPLCYSLDVFFLVTSDADRDEFLRSVAEHLEKSGAFVFNFLRYGPKRLDKPLTQIGERTVGDVTYKHFSSAEQVSERERKVFWIFEEWLNKKCLNRKEESFNLRLDSMDEIVSLFKKYGLRISEQYADVDRSALTEESTQALLVVR